MNSTSTPLILHIGRNKTGTTALQRFLGANRPALLKHGFVYPLAGTGAADLPAVVQKTLFERIGQHQAFEVAQLEHISRRNGHALAAIPLSRAAIRERGLEHALAQPVYSQIAAEFAQHNAGTTGVLSSEAFQNAAPETVRAAFPNPEIHIHGYLREQAGYLLSEYAQRVQASAESRSLRDYLSDWRGGELLDFVTRWSAVFGPERVHFYCFDAVRQASGGIVQHFMTTALGLDAHTTGFVQPPDDNANPTLDAELIAFKRQFNREHPDAASSQAVYHALRLMALARRNAPALLLPPGAFEDLRTRFDEHNEQLSAGFLPPTTPLSLTDPGISGEQPSVSAARYRALFSDLQTHLPAPL